MDHTSPKTPQMTRMDHTYARVMIEDPSLPSGWKRDVRQRKEGKSAGKFDVYILSPSGRRFRSRGDLSSYFDKQGIADLKAEDFDFSVNGKNNNIKTTPKGLLNKSKQKQSESPKKYMCAESINSPKKQTGTPKKKVSEDSKSSPKKEVKMPQKSPSKIKPKSPHTVSKKSKKKLEIDSSTKDKFSHKIKLKNKSPKLKTSVHLKENRMKNSVKSKHLKSNLVRKASNSKRKQSESFVGKLIVKMIFPYKRKSYCISKGGSPKKKIKETVFIKHTKRLKPESPLKQLHIGKSPIKRCASDSNLETTPIKIMCEKLETPCNSQFDLHLKQHKSSPKKRKKNDTDDKVSSKVRSPNKVNPDSRSPEINIDKPTNDRRKSPIASKCETSTIALSSSPKFKDVDGSGNKIDYEISDRQLTVSLDRSYSDTCLKLSAIDPGLITNLNTDDMTKLSFSTPDINSVDRIIKVVLSEVNASPKSGNSNSVHETSLVENYKKNVSSSPNSKQTKENVALRKLSIVINSNSESK